MLPPNTLRYLKGQYDSIVAVVLAAITLGAIAEGAPPWPAVACLSIIGIFYHVRRSAAERHMKEMAQLKVDNEVAKVEVIKARYRDLVTYEQASLPLVGRAGATIRNTSGATPRKGGKQ